MSDRFATLPVSAPIWSAQAPSELVTEVVSPLAESQSGTRRIAEVAIEAEIQEHLSFEQIYGAEVDFVARLVRRLGIPSAEQDDTIQDVFVVLHQKLPEFDGRVPIRHWLYRIVRNVCFNRRRSVWRNTLRWFGRGEPTDPDGLMDERQSPDQAAEHSEAQRLLYDLLAKLDATQREVFVLSELEGLTALEISEIQGVCVSTVGSRLRAARRRFDQALTRERAKTGRIQHG